MDDLQITGIAGTTYLCSEFVNHDGTIVSDHPLYLFNTNDKDVWIGVMFTSKTNPFTTHWRDGNDLSFICCSDHRGEVPTKKVFQSEIYVINKRDSGLKYSEYNFKVFGYHSDLLKALRNAVREGLSTEYRFGITSVHDYNATEDRDDKGVIMDAMGAFLDGMITKCNYAQCPVYGPENITYDEIRKFRNESRIKQANQRVFDNRRKSK